MRNDGDGVAVLWALRRLRERAWTILAFALAFNALNVVLLGPLVTAALRTFLLRWGRASVGNFEIVVFLLSPTGLAALAGVGTLALAVLYFELAGLMRLLGGRRIPWWRGLTGPAGALPSLVRLGARQLGAFLVLAAPFLAGIALAYGFLWRGRDIYGLIVVRPPLFWAGVGVAGTLVAAYALLAIRLFLRWLLAVPTLLFETDAGPSEALRRSVDRTKGRLGTIGAAILGWVVLDSALSAGVLALLKAGSAWALDRAGSRLDVALAMTAGLLALHALVVGALAIINTVGFAAVILAIYRWAVGPEAAAGWDRGPADEWPTRPARPPLRWVIVAGLVATAGLTVAMGVESLKGLSLNDSVELTAHRAGKIFAPENTVAALKRAIADRADWAEIDVQRTADDVLIVAHDTDLARIGGGPRLVNRTTLAEIKKLDVGALFGPEFAGERVPTLEEFMEAAGDKIRLNVELKPHGARDEAPLTERVVAAIQRAGMADRYRICSQSYAAIQLSRKLEPRMPIGFIAGAAIGDMSGLDVDFVMVRTELATRRLVDRAALQGMKVHAWTVNDPALLPRLLDRGVANVITDDPAAMRARLMELRGLSTIDRLLLRARNELID